MKRFLSLIAATAALGLAAFCYAGPPEEQAGAAQPAAPSATPPTDSQSRSSATGMQAETPATTQAGTTASQNTRLAALVPSGMSTQEACAGFKSVDECAATLHAAQNLSISFPDLKSKVTGGQSLGAAIKELKPAANVKAEVRKAQEQARSDTRSPQG